MTPSDAVKCEVTELMYGACQGLDNEIRQLLLSYQFLSLESDSADYYLEHIGDMMDARIKEEAEKTCEDDDMNVMMMVSSFNDAEDVRDTDLMFVTFVVVIGHEATPMKFVSVGPKEHICSEMHNKVTDLIRVFFASAQEKLFSVVNEETKH